MINDLTELSFIHLREVMKNIDRFTMKHSMQEVSDKGIFAKFDENGEYVLYKDVEIYIQQDNSKFHDSPHYIGHANDIELRDDDRQELWEEQYKKYGFDETVCWSFDYSIIQWILPRLKMFNKISKNVFIRDNMHKDLDKVIDVFEKYSGNECDLMDIEETQEFNEAWDLFTKHFHRLWI